ncbi:MAG: hypothetical protein ACEY3F_08760 [Wolbachia sp.]
MTGEGGAGMTWLKEPKRGVIPVWDPEKLIMYYTTFSIKSWIPDWNNIIGATFMTSFFFLDPSSQATRMTSFNIIS